MVNEFDLDRDLAATNPVRETSVSAILPPDVNELIVQQITESRRSAWRPRGINLARVGFVGVLASIGLVLLGLNFRPGAEVTEVAPAIRATPVETPETTTTTALNVAPTTTLVVSATSEESTTSTSTSGEATSTMAATSAPSTTTTAKVTSTVATTSVPADTAAPSDGEAIEPGSDDDGVAAEELPDDEEPCLAIGDTRREAIDSYKIACDLPRVDCDPIGDHWLCSSEQIGGWSP